MSRPVVMPHPLPLSVAGEGRTTNDMHRCCLGTIGGVANRDSPLRPRRGAAGEAPDGDPPPPPYNPQLHRCVPTANQMRPALTAVPAFAVPGVSHSFSISKLPGFTRMIAFVRTR